MAKQKGTASSKPLTAEEQTTWKAQTKTRVLLTLWGLGNGEAKVKKGDLTKSIVRTGETSKKYEEILSELQGVGAIALSTEKRVISVEITEGGKQILAEGLTGPGSAFIFEGNQVGSRLANALLNWMRSSDVNVGKTPKVTHPEALALKSYAEFKQVALDAYDRLNRDYNLDDLVPIYRIRRDIGEQVSRHQFNEWLLEMQAEDFLQLMAGEMPDMTSDKREDSITIPGGGLRYYAKRLNS